MGARFPLKGSYKGDIRAKKSWTLEAMFREYSGLWAFLWAHARGPLASFKRDSELWVPVYRNSESTGSTLDSHSHSEGTPTPTTLFKRFIAPVYAHLYLVLSSHLLIPNHKVIAQNLPAGSGTMLTSLRAPSCQQRKFQDLTLVATPPLLACKGK